jgi:hypothetical protein
MQLRVVQFSRQLNDDACSVQIQDHDDSLEILWQNYLIAKPLPSLKKRGQGRFMLLRRSENR